MKVVMVFAPGALALKQTDKMEKPMMWIPPPTMYLGSHNIYIFPTMYQKLPEIPYCSIIAELPEMRQMSLSESQTVYLGSIIVLQEGL